MSTRRNRTWGQIARAQGRRWQRNFARFNMAGGMPSGLDQSLLHPETVEPGPREPAFADDASDEEDLTLQGDVREVRFRRSILRASPILVFIPYLAPLLLRRTHVRWNGDTVVIERHDGGQRVPRADVVELLCERRTIALRLASGRSIFVVEDRRVSRTDVDTAGALAGALGVPLVDHTGHAEALPSMRVHTR